MTPLPFSDNIIRRRLSSVEDALFNEAWALYEASFPMEEKRMIQTQEEIMNHPLYHFDILILEEVFIGILLWWQFEQLRYVEHYAIKEEYRSRGFGKIVLEQFQKENKNLILLEVEKPENQTQKRRVLFYQNLGFKTNSFTYFQPPYSKTAKSIPLNLMTWPININEKILQYFINDCHSIIFVKK